MHWSVLSLIPLNYLDKNQYKTLTIGTTLVIIGVSVRVQLDKNQYKTGIKVTDEQFNTIAIRCKRFHGDWNYQISRRKTA